MSIYLFFSSNENQIQLYQDDKGVSFEKKPACVDDKLWKIESNDLDELTITAKIKEDNKGNIIEWINRNKDNIKYCKTEHEKSIQVALGLATESEYNTKDNEIIKKLSNIEKFNSKKYQISNKDNKEFTIKGIKPNYDICKESESYVVDFCQLSHNLSNGDKILSDKLKNITILEKPKKINVKELILEDEGSILGFLRDALVVQKEENFRYYKDPQTIDEVEFLYYLLMTAKIVKDKYKDIDVDDIMNKMIREEKHELTNDVEEVAKWTEKKLNEYNKKYPETEYPKNQYEKTTSTKSNQAKKISPKIPKEGYATREPLRNETKQQRDERKNNNFNNKVKEKVESRKKGNPTSNIESKTYVQLAKEKEVYYKNVNNKKPQTAMPKKNAGVRK